MTATPGIKPAAFPFAEIEPRWQRAWESAGIFHCEPSRERPNWVVVELPPFANGSLHMGHVRNYVMGDVNARFRRMTGYNVLYTSGFDSFGLPNELAAMEERCHPQLLAERVIAEMRSDFVRLGLSHDTRRIMGYHDESFYRWVQWVFLRLLEHGFAYRKNVPALWCGTCGLSLADSLVESGKCWRCHQAVQIRNVDQWMIRESEFAEELLKGLEQLPGWPEKIKRIHHDWIGRREGAELRFHIEGAPQFAFTAFLPEPALLPAVALIAIAPEHRLLEELSVAGLLDSGTAERIAALRRSGPARDYAQGSGEISESAFVRLNLCALHPLLPSPAPLSVFVGLDLRSHDGVLVMCPAHVRSDARIAEAAGMRAAPILRPAEEAATLASAFAWDETWIYSEGFMAGLPASEGRNQVMQRLQETGSGSPAVRYRLRDWSIARQRYWGPPVPVVYCPRCGPTGVPDDELPVRLPMDVDLPASNPLAAHAQFMKTTCPRCRSDAQRDSDTLEAYSSPWWYHWVCKGTATANPFDVEECRLYMPVDLLIGGEDQARTCFFHARMMARALKRAGVVEHEEPISGLLAIGMVKVNGRKMSKSEGNTVSPRNLMERYGADALRCAILGAAAPDSDLNWSDELAAQASSFMAGVWRFFETNRGHIRFEALSSDTPVDTGYSMSKKLARQVETAVARTTSALEGNLFHLAVRNLQMLFERIESYRTEAVRRRKIPDERDRMALAAASRVFLRLLAPICPHMAEEIWSVCGGEGLAAQAPWPAIAGVQKGAGR